MDLNGISDIAITNISKMGLQNLQNEPQRLLLESDRLNKELEDLVMENYRIFVENLTCSVQLRVEDKRLEEVRNDLKSNLNELSQICQVFRDHVNPYIESYKRNRKTLQHHMQLVELLEVPQLVDACSRNGFYDEALELANFINGLEKRHLLSSEIQSNNKNNSNNNNVVQSIVNDVYNTLITLRHQLIQLLSENSSLPKALQIINTMRKLDILLVDRKLSLQRHDKHNILFSQSEEEREKTRVHVLKGVETRIQMDFLEARAIWLDKQYEKAIYGFNFQSTNTSIDYKNNENKSSNQSIEKSYTNTLGPYGKAIEMIEVYRTSWFLIITQFNTLFQNKQIQALHPSNHILSIWIVKNTQKFLNQLTSILPDIEEGSSLRSVLEQSLFFAQRMKEVNCDFTYLLLPIFKNYLYNRISKEWKNSSEKFKNILMNEKINVTVDDISHEQIIPLYYNQEDPIVDSAINTISKSILTSKKANNDEINPPNNLLSFPPLAYLLNNILKEFNYVRECPMSILRSSLVHELSDIIVNISIFLIDSKDYLINTTNKYKDIKNNQSLDSLYIHTFIYELLPHILICFESLYPISKNKVNISALKVNHLIDLKDVLAKDLFHIYENAWIFFQNNNYIAKDIVTFYSKLDSKVDNNDNEMGSAIVDKLESNLIEEDNNAETNYNGDTDKTVDIHSVSHDSNL